MSLTLYNLTLKKNELKTEISSLRNISNHFDTIADQKQTEYWDILRELNELREIQDPFSKKIME